jgi:hypothetical protein
MDISTAAFQPLHILDCIEVRKNTLSQWKDRLSKEQTSIIDTFANQVFTDIVNNLKKSLTDPQYALYTKEQPCQGHYSFQIQNLDSLFKQILATDSIIKEWADLFDEVKLKEEEEPKVKLIKNSGYFNDCLATIGNLVKERLEEDFLRLASDEIDSTYLHFEVTFNREAASNNHSSSAFSKIKRSVENSLVVKAWIDSMINTPPKPSSEAPIDPKNTFWSLFKL